MRVTTTTKPATAAPTFQSTTRQVVTIALQAAINAKIAVIDRRRTFRKQTDAISTKKPETATRLAKEQEITPTELSTLGFGEAWQNT